jgi:hypothetical protein
VNPPVHQLMEYPILEKYFQSNRIIVEYHRRDQRWKIQEIQNNRQPRKMDNYAGVYEILFSFSLGISGVPE